MRIFAPAAALVLFACAACADDHTDLIKRGEYLARAADCVACHSAQGGQPYAGGRPFALPFGTLYSPNITPDQATGIGRYDDAAWLRMMHDGIAADGRHLYPAMPYTSYTRMTDVDALAIKAYLFSRPGVHATSPANTLSFPFDQRWTMVGWNYLYNPAKRFEPDAAKSPEWNRGAYLTVALGHCEQCHSPRTLAYGVDSAHNLAGAKLQGWLAYNLTADHDHGLGGWTDQALADYLATGRADGHGPASGPMAEAVENSLRYLTPSDIHAMVAYLKSVPADARGPAAAPTDVKPVATADDALGRRIYAEACAGCHLPSGDGRQSAYAALRGDHTAADPEGTNLVQILAQGSQMHTAQGLVFMHGFTGAYTDQELAALANYTTATFGGRPGHVTATQIETARKTAPPMNSSPGS